MLSTMQPTLQIRQANDADSTELARLRWQSTIEDGRDIGEPFDTFVASFRTFVEAALGSGSWAIWHVAHGRAVRGAVYVHEIIKVPRPNGSSRSFGYITAVYITPSVRNRGIGSRLLAAAVEWARTRGLESLILWPSERSVPFYERLGFAASADAMELALRP